MLQAAGIDVRRELRRGALLLLSARDAYLATGRFDPDRTIDSAAAFVAEASRDGFDGVYATGEMSWALGGDPGCERLVEYEARVASVFEEGTLAGLCQYDRRRFSPALLRDIVRTHPLVAFGSGLRENPFYDPNAACADSSGAAAAFERILSQIEAEARAPRRHGRQRRSADRVLVMERHAMLREALVFAFRHYGYEALGAASWTEATALVRSAFRPRLVLLGLAAEDGGRPPLVEVSALAQIPAIVLLGDEVPRLAAQFRTVAAVMHKTSPLAEIISVVEDCLARCRLEILPS